MNRWMMGTALTLGVGGVIGGSMRPVPVRGQNGPQWLTAYAEGQAAARQSHQPIFLVFR
jgi:hypothetical protein